MRCLISSERYARDIQRVVQGAARSLMPWLAAMIVSVTIAHAAEQAVATTTSNTPTCGSESTTLSAAVAGVPRGWSTELAYVRMK
jgi:hypothetical protein